MPRLSKARKELLTSMMKDSFFEATASVLNEHGVGGTTMNRVAEAAELAKSSLYGYFQNKEELLAFVAERIMAPTAQRIEEIAQAAGTAPDKLAGILHAALENVERYRALLVVLVRDQFRHRPEVPERSIKARVEQLVAAVFEQGIREGHFRQGDPFELSRLFIACLTEFCEIWIAADPPEHRDHCVERLMQVVLHGVSTGGSGTHHRAAGS